MAVKKKRVTLVSIENDLYTFLRKVEEDCESRPDYTFLTAATLADRLFECARNLYFIAAESMEKDIKEKKSGS